MSEPIQQRSQTEKRKRALKWILSFAACLILSVVLHSIRKAHWPASIEPSPDWERILGELDIEREQFFVQNGDLHLEADLLIPTDGRKRKGAVIFSPGSGDSLYQNYAKGLIKTYVFDVFLQRDMAVLLVNKRGMGKSSGNWIKNDFQGRADDLYAAVQHLQQHPQIDPEHIGVIGHSQGGWIVNLTASQHDDIAFFISLAGPTTTVEEQMEDTYENDFRCQGYTGDELAQRTTDQLEQTRLGVSIGEMTGFGMFGFDARIIGYDPRVAIETVRCPGLFVFGEHDLFVPAEANVERFQDIFDGHPPGHLEYRIVPKATHRFRVTETLCARATPRIARHPATSPLC